MNYQCTQKSGDGNDLYTVFPHVLNIGLEPGTNDAGSVVCEKIRNQLTITATK